MSEWSTVDGHLGKASLKEELVRFDNVKAHYSTDTTHFTLTYSLGPSLHTTPQDWIGLFPYQWHSTRNPLAFTWTAPKGKSKKKKTKNEDKRQVLFPLQDIPALKPGNQFYQLIYVSKCGSVCGKSKSFSIQGEEAWNTADVDDYPQVPPLQERSTVSQDSEISILSHSRVETIGVSESPVLLSYPSDLDDDDDEKGIEEVVRKDDGCANDDDKNNSDEDWEITNGTEEKKEENESSLSELSDIEILLTSPSKESYGQTQWPQENTDSQNYFFNDITISGLSETVHQLEAVVENNTEAQVRSTTNKQKKKKNLSEKSRKEELNRIRKNKELEGTITSVTGDERSVSATLIQQLKFLDVEDESMDGNGLVEAIELEQHSLKCGKGKKKKNRRNKLIVELPSTNDKEGQENDAEGGEANFDDKTLHSTKSTMDGRNSCNKKLAKTKEDRLVKTMNCKALSLEQIEVCNNLKKCQQKNKKISNSSDSKTNKNKRILTELMQGAEDSQLEKSDDNKTTTSPADNTSNGDICIKNKKAKMSKNKKNTILLTKEESDLTPNISDGVGTRKSDTNVDVTSTKTLSPRRQAGDKTNKTQSSGKAKHNISVFFETLDELTTQGPHQKLLDADNVLHHLEDVVSLKSSKGNKRDKKEKISSNKRDNEELTHCKPATTIREDVEKEDEYVTGISTNVIFDTEKDNKRKRGKWKAKLANTSDKDNNLLSTNECAGVKDTAQYLVRNDTTPINSEKNIENRTMHLESTKAGKNKRKGKQLNTQQTIGKTTPESLTESNIKNNRFPNDVLEINLPQNKIPEDVLNTRKDKNHLKKKNTSLDDLKVNINLLQNQIDCKLQSDYDITNAQKTQQNKTNECGLSPHKILLDKEGSHKGDHKQKTRSFENKENVNKDKYNSQHLHTKPTFKSTLNDAEDCEKGRNRLATSTINQKTNLRKIDTKRKKVRKEMKNAIVKLQELEEGSNSRTSNNQASEVNVQGKCNKAPFHPKVNVEERFLISTKILHEIKRKYTFKTKERVMAKEKANLKMKARKERKASVKAGKVIKMAEMLKECARNDNEDKIYNLKETTKDKADISPKSHSVTTEDNKIVDNKQEFPPLELSPLAREENDQISNTREGNHTKGEHSDQRKHTSKTDTTSVPKTSNRLRGVLESSSKSTKNTSLISKLFPQALESSQGFSGRPQIPAHLLDIMDALPENPDKPNLLHWRKAMARRKAKCILPTSKNKNKESKDNDKGINSDNLNETSLFGEGTFVKCHYKPVPMTFEDDWDSDLSISEIRKELCPTTQNVPGPWKTYAGALKCSLSDNTDKTKDNNKSIFSGEGVSLKKGKRRRDNVNLKQTSKSRNVDKNVSLIRGRRSIFSGDIDLNAVALETQCYIMDKTDAKRKPLRVKMRTARTLKKLKLVQKMFLRKRAACRRQKELRNNKICDTALEPRSSFCNVTPKLHNNFEGCDDAHTLSWPPPNLEARSITSSVNDSDPILLPSTSNDSEAAKETTRNALVVRNAHRDIDDLTDVLERSKAGQEVDNADQTWKWLMVDRETFEPRQCHTTPKPSLPDKDTFDEVVPEKEEGKYTKIIPPIRWKPSKESRIKRQGLPKTLTMAHSVIQKLRSEVKVKERDITSLENTVNNLKDIMEKQIQSRRDANFNVIDNKRKSNSIRSTGKIQNELNFEQGRVDLDAAEKGFAKKSSKMNEGPSRKRKCLEESHSHWEEVQCVKESKPIPTSDAKRDCLAQKITPENATSSNGPDTDIQNGIRSTQNESNKSFVFQDMTKSTFKSRLPPNQMPSSSSEVRNDSQQIHGLYSIPVATQPSGFSMPQNTMPMYLQPINCHHRHTQPFQAQPIGSQPFTTQSKGPQGFQSQLHPQFLHPQYKQATVVQRQTDFPGIKGFNHTQGCTSKNGNNPEDYSPVCPIKTPVLHKAPALAFACHPPVQQQQQQHNPLDLSFTAYLQNQRDCQQLKQSDVCTSERPTSSSGRSRSPVSRRMHPYSRPSTKQCRKKNTYNGSKPLMEKQNLCKTDSYISHDTHHRFKDSLPRACERNCCNIHSNIAQCQSSNQADVLPCHELNPDFSYPKLCSYEERPASCHVLCPSPCRCQKFYSTDQLFTWTMNPLIR